MLSSPRVPISGDGSPTTAIPNELWFEIVTRLPAKEVGRCRCVSKPWRRMIGSRLFLESHRKRRRGLIIYWSETINREDDEPACRLRFFHCPFRRLKEPLEEFIPIVPKLDLEAATSGGPRLSQLVDGLLCVGEGEGDDGSNLRLTLYNVCTGETMMIPDPLAFPYSSLSRSTCHLGYDRESREYKLLRLVVSGYPKSKSIVHGAHLLTLRPPSGSLPLTWKLLDSDASGLSGLNYIGYGAVYLSEARTCSSDGVISWIYSNDVCDSLFSFDFSREKFGLVELPDKSTINNFLAVTRFNGTLALWLDDQNKRVSCYVVEGEGKIWTRRSVRVFRHFDEDQGFGVASGKLPGSSSSNSKMLVLSPNPVGDDGRRSVHYYCTQHPDKEEEDVFFVGKLPDGVPDLRRGDKFHDWTCYLRTYGDKVPRLVECEHLYLSLDHMLDPSSATVLYS